jgi:hypothetical protein
MPPSEIIRKLKYNTQSKLSANSDAKLHKSCPLPWHIFSSFATICTCYCKTLYDMLHGNMVLHHPPLCGDAHEQPGQRKFSVKKQLSQLTALHNFQ